MDDDRTAAAARAARLADWPIVRYPLGEEPDEPVDASMNERLDMMWPLALDAWASSGKPLPSYERREAPGRVIRNAHDRRSDAE